MITYKQTTQKLVDRIVALGPQILDIDCPFKLFKIEGFHCDDLGPSLAQAQAALSVAKHKIKENINVKN